MKKRCFLMSLLCAFSFFLQATSPTDNPYRSFYVPESDHWTDLAIRWKNTVDISTTDACVADKINDPRFPDATDSVYVVDSAKLATSLQQLSSNGGVAYFPTGMYVFDFHLHIPSNVVLRGVTPDSSKQVATKNNFSPSTVFVFPKYIYSDTGNGTPNSSAFKTIRSASSCHNAGLVWLTINRAVIHFLPEQSDWSTAISTEDEAPYPGNYPYQQPKTLRTNIILFGLRLTNAVEADYDIPTSYQHAFQRWHNRRSANINAFIYENGVISNNRLNDVENCANFDDGNPFNGDAQQDIPYGTEANHPYTNISYPISSDEFVMPNYKLNSGTILSNIPFFYDYNPGININKQKLYFDTNKQMANWYPSQASHTIINEPVHFGTHIEIRDNWMFVKGGQSILASGLGIKIENNVLRDDKLKNDYFTPQVDPSGRNAVKGYSSYLRRGIEPSGW